MENAYLRVEEKDYSRTTVKLVKTRVNQSFFRSSVLSAYNNACAITNMKNQRTVGGKSHQAVGDGQSQSAESAQRNLPKFVA